MRSNALALLLLAGALGQSCGGSPPSRGSAADLIRPVIATKFQTATITLGYHSSDREGRVALNDGRFCDWTTEMRTATALSAAGHLDAPVSRGETRVGWAACESKPMYQWSTALPPGAEECCYRSLKYEENRLPTAEAIVAKAELIEVTGVTAPTQSESPAPTVMAEFTYRWLATDVGTIMAEEGQELPSEETQRGKATFVRYDDGWRLERLHL